MGDNIARELIARHVADDARHAALKLFHLESVRQDRRQLSWSQPLVTEGKTTASPRPDWALLKEWIEGWYSQAPRPVYSTS